jgi:CSLREA domain-containing protein
MVTRAPLHPAIPLLAAAAAIIAVPGVAAGASFLVNSTLDAVDLVPGNGVCAAAGDVCTLRAAVQEANTLAGSHEITLPAGIYTLTIAGRDEMAGATGDLNIGPDKTITINGAGKTTTIIDANAIDRAFRPFHGNLTLNDLTVRNGRAEGANSLAASGGCFYVTSGSLALARVVITGCFTASTNGGATSGAGMVTVDSTLTMVDSEITSNTVTGQGPGGGLYLTWTNGTITRSTIVGNSAQYGGGVYASGTATAPSAVIIRDSTIAQNVATTTFGGGGMFLSGNGAANLTVAIANTTIAGNSATLGPAGALNAVIESEVTLTNVTVSANSSATGGAVRAQTKLDVKNTIIANNTGAAPSNCAPGFLITSLGHNLEFPGTSCGFVLGSDRRADPLLNTLADNGGPTRTMALMPGSPAIDAGDDATCAAAPVSGHDQRGASRSVGAGLHCDMGGYELAPLSFTDDPLVAGTTAVKAVHITELRSRIDVIRVARGLAAYTDPDHRLRPAVGSRQTPPPSSASGRSAA